MPGTTPSDICSTQQKQRLLQPWDMHSKAGFEIPVSLSNSSIPECGLGRFAVMPVAKGAVVRADPIKDVADFIAAGGVDEKETVAIKINDASDINNLVEHFSKDNPDSEAHARKMMSWFMAGVPAGRSDNGLPLTYILGHSFHINHSHNHNTHTVVEDGVLYHKAVCDIAAGEELFLNYKEYHLEQHVRTWCSQHGLVDAQNLAEGLE